MGILQENGWIIENRQGKLRKLSNKDQNMGIMRVIIHYIV
jgi:hypothetical protein